MCRTSWPAIRVSLGILLSLLILAGCDDETPNVTGSGGDAPSGSGPDVGGFDFDTSRPDGSGSGDAGDSTGDSTSDDAGPPSDADCTRTNNGIEVCDGVDNDCDGTVDEDCDEDADGYCREGATVTDDATCEPGDCDDENAAVNPGAAPACDGIDNDCDGEVDNLVARPDMRQTVRMTSSETGSSEYPSPILAEYGDGGFCVAALDDSNHRLEFARIEADGGSSTHVSTVDRTLDADLLDLAWDGTHCVALYRDGPFILQIRRWRPGASTTNTLEVVRALSGDGDWENVRNAALWFGEVASCSEGRCTTQPRWVVAYLSKESSVSIELVYKTVPADFESRDSLGTAVTIDSSAVLNADVDVSGTGVRGEGFVVVDRASPDTTSVHEVVDEEATQRTDLTIDDADIDRPMLVQAGGELWMQRRRALSSGRFETVLAGLSTRGYRPAGDTQSAAEQRFVGRNFAWTIDGASQFYVDGYSDRVYRADASGIGDRLLDFTELQHPNFDRRTELLAPGGTGGYLWVASAIGDAPYEVALDAFACF